MDKLKNAAPDMYDVIMSIMVNLKVIRATTTEDNIEKIARKSVQKIEGLLYDQGLECSHALVDESQVLHKGGKEEMYIAAAVISAGLGEVAEIEDYTGINFGNLVEMYNKEYTGELSIVKILESFPEDN